VTLDAASIALLEQMRASGAPPIHQMEPSQARALGEVLRAQYGPGPEMASVRTDRVPASGGTVPVRVFVPDGPVAGLMIYFHGGGWVTGGLDDHDTLARKLAVTTRCTVILPDYRRAPEFRFPTAADDSYAVARWVADHMSEFGAAHVPLVVAGDSAGGNLAAVVAQRASRFGSPRIAAQVLVYPVLDCDFETVSYVDPANDLLLTRDAMIWFWDHYAPVKETRNHPDASPLRAPELSGLPPAIVLTAEHDVLRDEGELYATRLLKSGVPTQHRRFAGQLHGFLTMVNMLPGSDLAIQYIGESLAEVLAGSQVA
jgi:acetyl esterase